MNQYVMSALIAFVLLGMGISAVIMGGVNYRVTEKSKNGVLMWNICWSVFFWDFGYALMSLCYESSVAYVARAIALFFIIVFMIYILRYAASVSDYPANKLTPFLVIIGVAYIASWTQIIRSDAVTFLRTPWGYWYKSDMSWARGLQFASIIAAIVMYYVILAYGRKHKTLRRDAYVLKSFGWFGPILFLGYMGDTLIPILFHSAAIPGSCISAFFSAMVLFRISTNNKIFGLTKEQVSEYVFRDVNLPVIIANHEETIMLFNDIAPNALGMDGAMLERQPLESLFEVHRGDIVKIKNKEMVCKLERTDVQDKFGDLLYSIYFLHDITQERENLRTIQASQRMAEKANKAKSDFLANMSHEIRTPINAVLGMDEMILRECEDEDILEYAANIKQAGNLLLSLINDILDFSKIESGKMEILPAQYGVASVIYDLYTMSQGRAKKKGLSLDIEIDPQLPSRLYGDDVRIRQVITNLLTNAIKYTHDGGVLFSIRILNQDKKMAKLRVSVKDTGIGIREEDMARMFTAFQRVDEDVNRSIEGTGLGLSITMSLLDLMGSELQIDSAYGEGSEFYFDIEQEIVDASPIGEFSEIMMQKDRKKEIYQESFRAPEAKILVVDDNAMNLQIVQGLLKRTEVQITTAMSGYEGIEFAKKEKFHVIFMDHMMPGMDGIETVKRMREMVDYPSKDATIIALTANAVHGAKEMFLENGFDDFLSKPVKGSKLEEVLLKYLPEELIQEADEAVSGYAQTGNVSNNMSDTAAREQDAEGQSTKKSLTEVLRSSDRIQVSEGLKYCMDDVKLYEETLGIYVEHNEVNTLNNLLEKKDLANYAIKVHGVKSNSKNIGANELYTLALQLEMAAKDEDEAFLNKHHDGFIKEYQALLDEIKKCM